MLVSMGTGVCSQAEGAPDRRSVREEPASAPRSRARARVAAARGPMDGVKGRGSRCAYLRSCARRRAAAKALSVWSAVDLGGGALVRGAEAWPGGPPLGAAVRSIAPDRMVRLMRFLAT